MKQILVRAILAFAAVSLTAATLSAQSTAPAANPAPAAAPATLAAGDNGAASSKEKPSPVPFVAPPQKGMVWVNTTSGVYRGEGDKYYGRTKHGKYMTEADAIKAGYRAVKKGAKS